MMSKHVVLDVLEQRETDLRYLMNMSESDIMCVMEEKNKIYKPSQFAELINVHIKTLQKWDRKGILLAHRTPTNRRYYTKQQYDEYQQASMKERKPV